MIIELYGPSGVGKSTIIKKLCNLISSGKLPNAYCFSELNKEQSNANNTYLKKLKTYENGSCYFTNTVLNIVQNCSMNNLQKYRAVNLTLNSFIKYTVCRTEYSDKYVIFDEFMLNRANSFIHYSNDYISDAIKYFSDTPLPDFAICLTAKAETILERHKKRNEFRNCYEDLSDNDLIKSIDRLIEIDKAGLEIISKRGVKVELIDTDQMNSDEIALKIAELIKNYQKENEKEAELKSQVFETCKSFQKHGSRHIMRLQGIAYCAFFVPNFHISRFEAQRDTEIRFRRFGIKESDLHDKTVLDLGCNIGAMLFHASKFNFKQGTGIEYDNDKIEIGKQIAKLANIRNIDFRQGDLDKLDSRTLPKFDVVFALAIEGHVQDRNHLFSILGKLSSEKLYFEGNASCDIEKTSEQLRQAGFSKVEFLGFSSDDLLVENNKRPLLVATKARHSGIRLLTNFCRTLLKPLQDIIACRKKSD